MSNTNAIAKRQILEPTNLQEAKEFAETLSKSGLVPREFQAKPANILVAVQWGFEIGLAPMQALQNIAVINGRPSLWGDSLLALVKGHKAFAGAREWMEGDTAFCEIKRTLNDGNTETTVVSFSQEDAVKAKLWGKQGPWQQYPKRMLQLRARGFAIRDAFPDAVKGLITAEEAADYPKPDPKDITPRKGVEPHPSMSEGDTNQKLEEVIEGHAMEQQEAHRAAVIDNMADHAEPGEDETETPDLQQDEEDGFKLIIPNVEGQEPKTMWFNEEIDFANQYAELMLRMYQSTHKDLPPAVKRTKLKQLEEANSVAINEIKDDQLRAELIDKRKEYNKSLSIMARENPNE